MEKFIIGDLVFVSNENHIHEGKVFTVTEVGEGIVYDNKTWYEFGDVTLLSRPTQRPPDASERCNHGNPRGKCYVETCGFSKPAQVS